MNIRRFTAVLKTRNLEFIRDKSALGWNLFFPIIIVLGFAFAFSNKNVDVYKVGYYGDLSDSLKAQYPFFHTQHIKFFPIKDVQSAITNVERHKLDMLIDLPRHQYWINNESPSGYILEKLLVASQTSEGQSRNIHASKFPMLEKKQVSQAEIRYVDWLLPGILAMNIMFSALYGVGYVIVRYRKNGVLKRLKATPLTAAEFLSAQVASRLLLVMAMTIIVYMGTNLLLDIPMHGSYINLFLMFLLGSISMISIGLLVATRTASEEFAEGMLNFISWPMVFLSGVWFSLEGVHPWLQKLAVIFPLTHLISGARAVMIDGAGFVDILPDLATLAVMSIVFLVVGAFLFRWE